MKKIFDYILNFKQWCTMFLSESLDIWYLCFKLSK
jgi:hypothetical protein